MWTEVREADGVNIGTYSPYEGILTRHEHYQESASVMLYTDSYPDGFLVKGGIFGGGGDISKKCATQQEADKTYAEFKEILSALVEKMKTSPGDFLKEWEELKEIYT